MRAVVVIPARYKSSRFHGKPLVLLLGKPMIRWVAEIAEKAVGVESVYVATDDRRIQEVVVNAGYQALMTSENALTGTDRVAEAAKLVEADIYVNVQGDEPLLSWRDIVRVIDAKKNNMDKVINCFSLIRKKEEADNRNIPKIITTENSRFVYASRCPLPAGKNAKLIPESYKKQVCIYAYTKEELDTFRKFGRKSQLEFYEDIEILRFLEFDKEVLMIEVEAGSIAVDVPEDVGAVELKLSGRESGPT